MCSQVDEEEFSATVLEIIIDHQKDDLSVLESYLYVITMKRARQMKTTTHGQKHTIKWKYDSKTQILLKDIKESHPIEVVEYAMAHGIRDDPAFAWWVIYTL